MTITGPETPSWRMLLGGGPEKSGSPPTNGWEPAVGFVGGSSVVLWAGWADTRGAIVGGDDGIILSHDGASWTRHTVPVPVPIHAFWGRDRENLWAVGWMGLLLRFDGQVWNKVRGCVSNKGSKYADVDENIPLFAISGRRDGHIWAVGDRGTVLRFDGVEWRSEVSGTRQHLRAVSCLADGRVVAVGGDGCVLIRDTAGRWRRLDNPHRSNFMAAVPLADGAVLLAGGRYLADKNNFRGDLVLMRNAKFERLFSGAEFSRFRALAHFGSYILAVGDGGQIHRLREGGLDRLDSGTTHDLFGVVRLPGGSAMSIGDFGSLLVCSAPDASATATPALAKAEISLWEAQDCGTDRQLWGLWQDFVTGQLHACGEEGTVLLRDRDKWERLPPVSDLGIYALNRAPDGGLLAAGQLGQIYHFDGTRWRKEFDLRRDATILSLWSDGANGLIATGDEGLILKNDIETGDWTTVPSGTKSALYGLWGLDERHLLAVGDFGLVLRWNGTRWDEFNSGTKHFLFDVWGRALDDIYVVGMSGTISHFDGRRWTITPVRTRADILAIDGTEQDAVAVGAAGTVFRNTGIGWIEERTGTAAGLRAVAAVPGEGYVAAGDRGTLLVKASGP